MVSRFLPQDFDPQKSLAVIAGRGFYPVLTVELARAQSIKVQLIAFEGETREELFDSFAPEDRKWIKVGQVGHMLKALQKFGAGYAIMAGQITPRRLFKGLHPDIKAVKILASLKERNAETIFGALATEIKNIGVHQLDARAFLDSEMADEGLMAKGRYQPEADTLEHGIRIAKEIARLDIGQGVVVSRGTVLAVEAFEGTDPMLKRSGTFGAKETLFIKTVKPGQDTRFDVPVFGMQTLDVMTEAGITAAALEASNTIILEKENVLMEAKKRKITLLGY
ncbi:LpxI family protein [Rubellicoccus peritrichatus]|uniref:UDP-2,3-diacylglucosamine diphosphatase LpxI n=1 Tax=Rubellicoccus peritrichatus TaxID=3080537 RepID=A0AAQ3LA46_9BACT|nr:UDP-2,3-diacylglucosamine diphosphatase LpxI [Puniceicoccus sp. CR14]WOO41901.1 UDP-2,3-diacylglucosamine diphosphatase LpxI [Puniceicoccus sp. CR14]